MSLAAMSWAWDQVVKPASAKLVLLCLADAHNSETGRCYPSAPYIASKTGQDKKTVYAAILKLEEQGYICTQKALGKSPEYTLNLTQERVHPRTGTPENGDTQNRVGTLPENGSGPYPKTGNKPVNNQEGTLKEISEPSEFREFAEFMWSRIQPLTHANQAPNFDKWETPIRLLVQKDGRDLEIVRSVFLFANTHQFWSTNILSPDKLRKQFPNLFAQWSKANENPRDSVQRGSDQRRLSPGERVRQRRAEAAERQARATN